MSENPKSKFKMITTGLLASSIAVSAFAISPTNSNIIAFPSAFAEAVRVEAPQAPSFADVVEAVSPAVVSVRVEQTVSPASNDEEYRFDRRFGDDDKLPPFFRNNPDFFDKFFEQHKKRGGRDDRQEGRRSQRDEDQRKKPNKPRRGMSQGSGFFVSEDGYLVTNNHVVDNGSKFTVVMDDGTKLEASLIGADERSDLAVLKVDNADRKFTYVSFGEKDPRIGDWVVAVGNPFGLGGTVTAGIISARGREIGANRYDDFIQIDAAVNKGNSGGPAFNLNGEVIGVNTAIFSPSGGNVGIAFAIPAATASEIVTDLITNGKVVRGWLGVQIQPVTQDIADSLGLESAEGAIVAEPQPNSPADKAGIRAGDVITSVDGKKVKNPRELARIVARYNPESKVMVSIWRDGNAKDISVTLGTLEQVAAARGGDQKMSPATSLGLSLKSGADGTGVVVTEVEPGSPAAEKGIESGDIVASVNGEEVNNPQDVAKIVKQASELGRKATLFQIKRDGNSRFVAVPLKRG